MDRAVARRDGTTQQVVEAPLMECFYAPDELEILDEAPADRQRPRQVRDNLRELGAEVAAAAAASDHDDWAAALEAVRMIHGRAAIARRVLEGMLGANVADDLPSLVRAVQAVGRVISDREVDSLAPDELRTRMHAVLEALDRELRSFLEPPEEEPNPADRDLDAPAHNWSGPEQR